MKKLQSILALSCEDAKAFFLRHDSYTSMDLPTYFNFSKLLRQIDGFFQKKGTVDFTKAGNFEKVNHSMLIGKGGGRSWRRIEFIHPALYVGLVREITQENRWEHIKRRFAKFHQNKSVECMSIPVVRPLGSKKKQKAHTILDWWTRTEQQSIALALEYGCVLHTDIANCYDSIYTHSIDWAMHGKKEAKQGRKKSSVRIGGMIDQAVRNMRNAQTNGIPQGATLMDFIAEMVLGYADTLIDKEIRRKRVEGVKILRFRDDYRIFADGQLKCETVLKIITAVMIEMGMSINPSKTIVGNDVVRSSVKAGKLAWFETPRIKDSPQKQLLIIHGHAKKHPDSGSLLGALTEFYKGLPQKKKWMPDVLPMISIATDIASRNHNTYPHAAAIINKLLIRLDDKEREDVCKKIADRFRKAPYGGHMEVWLQRITLKILSERLQLEERLTQLNALDGNEASVWNNDWVDSKELKNLLEDSNLIIDKDAKERMDAVVSEEEVDMFRNLYY